MARNKHDLLFRKTFNNVEMFRKFCEIHLPEDLRSKINLDQLKLRKLSGSFIRTQIMSKYGEQVLQDKQRYEELKEEIADVVYSAKFHTGEEILLIFHAEHQSKPDKLYPLRNALYDISAIKDYMDQYKPAKIPVPISLLYYHGRPSPYPHTTDIMDLFSNKEIAQERFLKPFLVDLGTFTDDELLAHGEIGGFEISYKHTYDKSVQQDKVIKLVEALKNCSDVELRRAWYTYTLNTWEADKAPMLDAYRDTIPNDQEFIMTAVQQIKTEALNEVALAMLKDHQPIEIVAKYSNLTEKEVLNLKQQIKH